MRLGPRFLISRTRMRSSNSMGAYMPLGRKTSARISFSYILIFPEKRMAGVDVEISLIFSGAAGRTTISQKRYCILGQKYAPVKYHERQQEEILLACIAEVS